MPSDSTPFISEARTSMRLASNASRLSSILLPVLLLVSAAVAVTRAETLDEVLGRHFDARGGLEKLTALRSLRMAGSVEAGGFVTRFVVTRSRPSRIRIELDLEGELMLRVFDGSETWGINPLEDETEPGPLSNASAANLRQQSRLDSLLVAPGARNASLTLVGREERSGLESWRIDAELEDGTEHSYWIDAESYRLHERTITRRREGGFTEMKTRWSDHRLVSGVLFAHRQKASGRQVTQTDLTMSSSQQPPRTTIYDTIQVDPDIDPEFFSKP